MATPVSGHNAVIAMEKDGDAAGTFTDIATLTSPLPFEMFRDTSEQTAHGQTIDRHLFSPVMKRRPLRFSGTLDYDEATHDFATGLGKRYTDGDTFGLLYKGPDWVSGTDEIIVSGALTNYSRNAEMGAGPYTFEAEFQPSGAMKIDGSAVGT